MYRRALVVAVAVAACGPPAPVARTQPVVLGEICADGATPGVGGAALLTAGEAALARGCAKEALLDAIGARGTAPAGRVAYVILAATAQVRADLLVGGAWGHEGYAPVSAEYAAAADAWFTQVYSSGDGVTELFDRLAVAARDGSVARGGQRLALLYLRFMPSVTCLPTRTGGVQRRAEKLVERADLLKLYVDKYNDALTNTPDELGMTRVDAQVALGQCEHAAAEKALEKLISAYEKAGRTDDAVEARLDWIEVRYFAGGRAGNLGREFASSAEVDRERARDLEAAAHGEGVAWKRATAADEALAKLVATPLAPPTLARATWLQAAVAYRLLGRPMQALGHARRAMELAVASKRADLLDASRVVAALAAAELGRADEARDLLRAAFASVTRRGVVGVRRMIIEQLGLTGTDLVARGRRQEALVVAVAARDAARDLNISETYGIFTEVPTRLNELGRLEEALLENRRADAALAAFPPSAQREAYRSTLTRRSSNMESQLGRAPSTAVDRGDTASLATWLRSGPPMGDLLRSSDATCLAATEHLLAAGKHILQRFYTELKGEFRTTDEEGVRILDGFIDTGARLTRCGRASRNREVFDVGMKLLQLAGAHPDELEHAANAAAAAGDLARAAETWIRMDREQLERLDARGAFETSRRAGELLEDAALAYLQMAPPRTAEAVELLERSRARDLRAARSSRRRDARDPALAALTDVESRLAEAAARARALAGLDAGGRELAGTLAAARREVERLTTERERVAAGLSTSDPIAYRAAAIAPPPGAAALQKRLGADEAVVYYLVRPLEAWAIVVDRAAVRAFPLRALDGDRLPLLLARLNAYRRAQRAALEGRGLVRVQQTADAPPAPVDLPALRRELYDLLVRPLEAAIPPNRRVMIVPDSHTSDLAFAELGAPDAPWIARNPLRLLPGTYLLGEAPPAKGASLVVGDVAFGAGATLAGDAGEITWGKLPGTRVEAVAVARGLGATAVLGKEATEEEVKRRMADAALIHLATHGNADPVRPSYSVIALATPGAGAREDGLLYAFEIERLRLRARLVVLSACETGKGSSRGSEGVLALDRAFLVAGASTVLSSLWVVPDDATAALMTELYAGLARGRAVDVALADAMNVVRANPRWADPTAWAAFRVVGTGK